MWVRLILAVVAGYLLGAVPVGYLVGRVWGVDVRRHGSGRTGVTNVWRSTKTLLPPALTILGDVAKGVAAVLIGRYLLGSELAAALAGTAAVAGHNWSVLLGWRGGAGGVTAGAALLALSPVGALVVIVVALLALYLSHYASVGTLTVGLGGLVMLGILALLGPAGQVAHLAYGAPTAVWIVLALQGNLKRLAKGTERRITLW